MIWFSLGVLIPSLMVACLGEGYRPIGLALSLVPPAAWLMMSPGSRSTRTVIPVLAGCLAVVIGNQAGHRNRPELQTSAGPRTAQVRLVGSVQESRRTYTGDWLLKLGGGIALKVAGSKATPLPLVGTRVRGLARWESSGGILRVPDPTSLERVAPPWWNASAQLDKLRRLIGRHLDTGVSAKVSAHLRALLLGQRSLSFEARALYARTGTLHFFAVSGLHLAMVMALAARLFGLRAKRQLPLLASYAVLCGFRSPVGRALLMASGALLAKSYRRVPPLRQHLLLVAAILLTIDPSSLRHPGFQLSFAAFGGIVLLARPVILRRQRDPWRRIVEPTRAARLGVLVGDGLIVSTAAFLASAPVAAAWFHRLSPGAIPAGILIAPLIPILLALGIVQVMAPGLAPVSLLLESTLECLQTMVEFIDFIPGCSFIVTTPSLGVLFAQIAVILTVALRYGLYPSLASPRLLICAALAVPALSFVPCPLQKAAVMLDAGRGTSILLSSNDSARKPILLDCGPASARIANALLDRGIGTLESVILSHLHDDHCGGAPDVAQMLAVGQWYRGPSSTSLPIPSAKTISRGSRVAPRTCVLWPPLRSHADLGANDQSVVVHHQAKGHSLLLTGDLESEGLRRFLKLNDELSADCLLLPHHGAECDSLADLILRSRPDQVWVPARSGFPKALSLLTCAWAQVPSRQSWNEGEAEIAISTVWHPRDLE